MANWDMLLVEKTEWLMLKDFADDQHVNTF
jgi:hypothetical protein